MMKYRFDHTIDSSDSGSEPRFDDERTLLSARRVVPLEKINAKVRHRKHWFLGGAFAVAMMLGAASALLASYLKTRNVQNAPVAVTQVDVPDEAPVDVSENPPAETPVAAVEEPSPEVSPEMTATEKATVEVGGPSTLQEFTENLTGTTVNEEKTFSVTYRDDYPEKRLAGKTLEYQVKVEAIKQKDVPELNDEFAQRLGQYSTFEELRTKVRQDLEKHRREHANEELREKLLRWLEEHNEFEVPESLVERQIQIRMQRLLRDLSRQGINPQRLDVDWAKIGADQRQQAIRDVKGSLLLSYVAHKEKIDVNDHDVETEIDRIATEMNNPRQRVREILTKDSGMARLRSQIQNRKTLDFLKEHAVIQPAVTKE